MNATVSPSLVSRPAKAAGQVAAILRKLDEDSIDQVLTVVIMANQRYRGMSLEKLATCRRLPSRRFLYEARNG